MCVVGWLAGGAPNFLQCFFLLPCIPIHFVLTKNKHNSFVRCLTLSFDWIFHFATPYSPRQTMSTRCKWLKRVTSVGAAGYQNVISLRLLSPHIHSGGGDAGDGAAACCIFLCIHSPFTTSPFIILIFKLIKRTDLPANVQPMSIKDTKTRLNKIKIMKSERRTHSFAPFNEIEYKRRRIRAMHY